MCSDSCNDASRLQDIAMAFLEGVSVFVKVYLKSCWLLSLRFSFMIVFFSSYK